MEENCILQCFFYDAYGFVNLLITLYGPYLCSCSLINLFVRCRFVRHRKMYPIHVYFVILVEIGVEANMAAVMFLIATLYEP